MSSSAPDTDSRWFVLPLVGTRPFENSPGIEFAPKYADREGIRGWSGTDHEFDAETYPLLPFAVETMFVGKVYGTAEALDGAAAEPDTFGKTEFGLSDEDIAGYLNDRLGRERTFGEWVDAFGISE